MNPVIEELLQIVETDPLPEADTSSHWSLYGRKTIVERRGDNLVLIGSGFGSMDEGGRLARAAGMVERLTYWPVTTRIRSYASIWRTARRLAHDLSVDLRFDVWKQSVALALLADHWAAYSLSPRTFAVIGDGHGFLGALIRRHFPHSLVYCIDLPKILVFQAHTHELADPGASMSLLSTKPDRPTAITLVQPKDIEAISDQIDCAINIASMQEMNPHSIDSYFKFLRIRSTQSSRFYCVNHLRKELPGGRGPDIYRLSLGKTRRGVHRWPMSLLYPLCRPNRVKGATRASRAGAFNQPLRWTNHASTRSLSSGLVGKINIGFQLEEKSHRTLR